jgi:response regulator RpfG family c-di-GMP phosphodiesterase
MAPSSPNKISSSSSFLALTSRIKCSESNDGSISKCKIENGGGARALEHFQINAKRYGLLISDLRMPGMNGYEFVKKVNEIKSEIKIFLMTAFEINDVEFKKLLPKVKIECLFKKPISLAHLISTVSKYISTK